jgi:diguanylate cyclase (GGDEF)-like protein
MSVRFHDRFGFRLAMLGVGLILLGLAVRMFIGIPELQDQIRQGIAAQQTSVATYFARDVEAEISERRELTVNLAQAFPPQLVNRPAEARQWLREHQQLFPLFRKGLVLVSPDGAGLIAEYPSVEGRAALDYSDKDWFIAARRGTDVLGAPFRGRASGEPLMVMAAPVRDNQGHVVAVLGTVSILMGPGFVDVQSDPKAAGGVVVLSPRDGVIVASSDTADILQPLPRPGINSVYDRAIAMHRGVSIATNANGVEELSAVATVPSTGWVIIAHLPTAEAFRPAEVVRGLFLRHTFIVLVILLLVMLVAVPRMLRPLVRAAEEMRRMADGEVPLRPLPIQRYDEVGEMASGFNALLDKLQKQEAALREHEAALAHLATHDPLTGLPNRALLEDRVDQALARALRSHRKVALLFCDLDGFKEVNDTHGHEVGDEVLREVANRLTDGRRRADTVARLGGDEFVILLPDLEDGHSPAKLVAEFCIDSLRKPIVTHSVRVELGMSIGIALYPDAGSTASELLACADAAMYKAKRRGKGTYVFIDAPAADQVPERPVLRVIRPEG